MFICNLRPRHLKLKLKTVKQPQSIVVTVLNYAKQVIKIVVWSRVGIIDQYTTKTATLHKYYHFNVKVRCLRTKLNKKIMLISWLEEIP